MTSFLYMGLGESISREALTTGGRYTSELIENGAKINQLLERLGLATCAKSVGQGVSRELVPRPHRIKYHRPALHKRADFREHQKAIKEIFGS